METSLVFPKAEEDTLHCEHFHFCSQCFKKFRHIFAVSVIPFQCSWKGVCVECQQNLINETKETRERLI